jgi:hypothetical protein
MPIPQRIDPFLIQSRNVFPSVSQMQVPSVALAKVSSCMSRKLGSDSDLKISSMSNETG